MGRLEAGEAADREPKINLLRLNKLILVVPGRAGGWEVGGSVVGRLEAGEAADRESKINLLRLNKFILVVPGRGRLEAGRQGVPGRGLAGGQNQFVEAQLCLRQRSDEEWSCSLAGKSCRMNQCRKPFKRCTLNPTP